MYTYKCEKCGKEFDVEEILEEDTIHMEATEIEFITAEEKRYGKNSIRYCGGKLYRVYKPPAIIIR